MTKTSKSNRNISQSRKIRSLLKTRSKTSNKSCSRMTKSNMRLKRFLRLITRKKLPKDKGRDKLKPSPCSR